MAIATTAFLAAWLPSGRDAVTLVKVELTDPSALTLYLATREVTTPAATPQFWQGALSDAGPVVEPGNLGTYDPGLATFDFTLSGRPLAGQGADDSALDKLASHYWYGATVTAYWWETTLTDFADALQIFKGVVIEQETDSERARIYCQQRNSWIVRVPAQEVTRAEYPRAPEKSIGRAIPICYGDLRSPPARSPASEYGLFQQGITSVAGMRRAGVRGVVTRLGKGGSGEKGQVLFAGHACKLFNSDVDGSSPAIELGGLLCEIDPIGADVINASTGTGFNFADVTSADVQPFDVFFPVLLVDSRQPASNPADGGRAATDPFNDTSYAEFDYDGNQREMRYLLPDVVPVGQPLDIKVVAGWLASGGAGTVPPDLALEFVGVGGSQTPFGLTNSATPTANGASVSNTAIWPTDVWSFAKQGCYLRVYYSGVATGDTARVFYVGLVLRVRPSWPVVTPAKSHEVIKPGIFRPKSEWENWYTPKPATRTVTEPEATRIDSAFYATLQGYADDGGGTYTGTASALIQRPPDILRHFLATYCGETLFETASSNPGDLEDLRDALKTWRTSDMVAAFAIDELRMSSDVVRDLARSTLCWFFISCFDNKWCGVPWKAGRAVDFPRRLTRYDLTEDFVAGPAVIMHRDEVINDLRVGYGLDAWSRRTVHETRVGPNHSSSGHKWRQLRDERITVVASESDRIDFTTTAAGAVTASLTAGDYTPASFRSHVDTQMSAVAGQFLLVTYGMLIEENVNDSIPINDGASKEAVIAAGDYNGNPTGLATAAQAALNAVSSNWTVTYSATTQKFTIDRSAGTKQVNWSSGTGSSTPAAAALGFRQADLTASITSDFAVESERYVVGIQDGSTISIEWETGANGIDAATPRAAGALLGFDMARDYAEGASYALAHSPKGTREHDCTTSVTRFGARPETSIELTAVNDTDTAREVRNRILDLWGQPPVEIQFATERMPDLQRGMVFDFDSSIDDVKPYPVPGSDGSWAGKEFVAVRVERRTFPTPHVFVVAFEVPAA